MGGTAGVVGGWVAHRQDGPDRLRVPCFWYVPVVYCITLIVYCITLYLASVAAQAGVAPLPSLLCTRQHWALGN